MASMYVSHLKMVKFRGLTIDLKFDPRCNLLVGINGCGKTTILNLIAILTGNESTELLTQDEAFGMVSISVECVYTDRYGKIINEEKKTLTLTDHFDWDKINSFKQTLPVRTSYVLSEDLWEDRFVSHRQNAAKMFQQIQERLAYIQQERHRTYSFDSNHHTFLMSPTGAARYLLMVGLRLPPSGVPMLVDNPERHLHINSRYHLNDFYNCDDTNQMFYTTHCPTVYSGMSQRKFVGIFDVAAHAKKT